MSVAVPRIVWLIALWLIWGTSWSAMRMVFLELPIWQFRAASSLTAGLGLLAVARLSGERIAVPKGEWAPLLLVTAFNIAVWHIATGYGLSLMGSGHAALVAYTMPVWAALLGAFVLRERLSPRRAGALALGMGGLVVLLAVDFRKLGGSPAGLGFMLIAAMAWAFGTVMTKRTRWTIGLSALAGWQLTLAALPIAVVAAATERFALHEASLRAGLAALYVTLIATAGGYWLWFKVVAVFPATVAAIGSLVTPALAVLGGAVALGEPLTWRELLSMALVLAAVALVTIRPEREAPARPR